MTPEQMMTMLTAMQAQLQAQMGQQPIVPPPAPAPIPQPPAVAPGVQRLLQSYLPPIQGQPLVAPQPTAPIPTAPTSRKAKRACCPTCGQQVKTKGNYVIRTGEYIAPFQATNWLKALPSITVYYRNAESEPWQGPVVVTGERAAAIVKERAEKYDANKGKMVKERAVSVPKWLACASTGSHPRIKLTEALIRPESDQEVNARIGL